MHPYAAGCISMPFRYHLVAGVCRGRKGIPRECTEFRARLVPRTATVHSMGRRGDIGRVYNAFEHVYACPCLCVIAFHLFANIYIPHVWRIPPSSPLPSPLSVLTYATCKCFVGGGVLQVCSKERLSFETERVYG